MKKLNKKGFTIVELVIVIAVIAILAGVMIPTFSGVVDKANESKAMQEVKNAYVATISDELATPDTDDDKVYNAVTKQGSDKPVYVKGTNEIYVQIKADGSVVIPDETPSSETLILKGGKLEIPTSTNP